MSTPSKNTRAAAARAEALIKGTTTAPSANATPKSATKKPKGTLKKNITEIVGRMEDHVAVMRKENAAFKKTTGAKMKRLADGQKLLGEQQRSDRQWTKDQQPGSAKKTPKAKKEEETTETAIVAANSGPVDLAKTLEKIRAENKASEEEINKDAKALAKRQTKLEKDQSKLKKTVDANHQWTKNKFAAQSKQNKKFAAQFNAQDEKIATIGEDQEGTQSDLARLRMAVVGLRNTMQGGLKGLSDTMQGSIEGLSDTMVGALCLFDARTQANRNFASTAAFFAIVLAIVLGHYLLATTFLAITLGFYFVKNPYKK